MQEDFQLQPQVAARRARAGRSVLLTALIAFLLGAGVASWLTWRGSFDPYLPEGERAGTTDPAQLAHETDTPELAAANRGIDRVSAFETRLALLEDRFSRLNLQANAASGNAARAEGLLIAFAARRVIARGEPLGYLQDQLRLRFSNAQPRAVQMLIGFSRDPVTLDELDTRLDALAPELADLPREIGTWARVKDEFANLFVVRRDPSLAVRPEARIERAKLMLAAGQIDEAIGDVSRLPGATAASKWIEDARRYGEAQQSLDLIETTAMIEPRRLQDANGKRVDQQSPLAQPPPSGTAAP